MLVVVVGDDGEVVPRCFEQSSPPCPFPVCELGLCSQSRAQMDCSAHLEVTTAHEELEA